MKGLMTNQYTVWCGLCDEWIYVDGKNKQQAGLSARLFGWKNTKAHGWVCRDCLKKDTKKAQESIKIKGCPICNKTGWNPYDGEPCTHGR